MDVGENTTAGNGSAAHESVELLIVADGELEVAGSDGLLLVLSSGVAGKLEDFARKVLEDGGGEDTSANANLLGIASLSEHPGAAANGEDEIGSAGGGACLRLASSALSGCHLVCFFLVRFKL